MTTKTMACEPDSSNELKFGFWMGWKVCVAFTNCSRSILNTIIHCSTIITKTTDKSQTSTDKSQTSHRRVTDDYRQVADESQTTATKVFFEYIYKTLFSERI